MMPALVRRDDKGAGFNCACPYQRMPMGLAGGLRKRGRNRNEFGPTLRQGTVKRTKTQVIAYRQTELAPLGFNDDRPVARRNHIRFTISLAVF